MYVANTHLKPVIGIDIHFVNLPFPFVPIPHPYIGLVFDPFDYIPFIGATVKVNGVPRGNTDTMGMIITFVHIPLGAGFTIFPIIGHNSQNFFGSKKVMVDGAPMSGAGYILMTCNDIGIPLSFRPGEKFIPIPSLYLPTSFCVPLQWGKPVNVGGPLVPHFSLMALLKAFIFGCFLKVLGKLLAAVMKKMSAKLAARLGASSKLKNILCKMGFEPVDLITGRVNYEYADFELPGPIPLLWRRNWDSDATRKGLLGHGTHLAYDRYIQLVEEENALALLLEDGRVAAFPWLQPGEAAYNKQERLHLHRKPNGNFLLEDPGNARYLHFNHYTSKDIARLSFIEDYYGFRIQLHYTGARLTALTDSAGRRLILHYDRQQPFISSVELQHKGVSRTMVSYSYTTEGDCCAITDALGQTTSLTFDNHRMVKKTDRNGQRFYWEYDEKGRCFHTWGDGGLQEGWITFGEDHTIVTNSLGEHRTYWFDENKCCVRETDHYGNSRHTEYTDELEIYRTTDELGSVTGYSYDEKGRLKEKIFPDNTSVQYFYNDNDQLKLKIYPDGTSDSYGYDAERRLRFENHPNGQTTSYEFNEKGQLSAILFNGKEKTSLDYDDDENLVRMYWDSGASSAGVLATVPAGAAARSSLQWVYDPFGRCTQAISAQGEIRHYSYDAMGRLTHMHLPDGNAIHLKYDAYTAVTAWADGNHHAEFEYTPLGSLSLRRQNGTEQQYLYDKTERLKAVVNESGQHYRFEYNHRGEIIAETGFDGIKRQYNRDAAGRVIRTDRPGNRHTKYEYDAGGRLIHTEYHDGSWEHFRYDRSGWIAEAANEHTTIRFRRDALGMVTEEWMDDYCIKSRYDKNTRRMAIESSLGAAIGIRRNAVGEVISLDAGYAAGARWHCDLQYNPSGLETARHLPGGISMTRSYDPGGRPGEQKVTRNNVVLSWKKYTWDTRDRLTHVADALTRSQTTFRQDAWDNLVFAQYADTAMVRAMDETGNIYETREKNDRTFDPAGALLTSRSHKYTYDEEGNRTGKTDLATGKRWSYQWLANGMLGQVTRPDGKTVCFKYDALRRRIEKSFDGTVTRYLWDGNTILHEWRYREDQRPQTIVTEAGELQHTAPEPTAGMTTWVYDADGFAPAARLDEDHAQSIVCDYLGTPQVLYDEQGKISWEGVLDIYGRVRTLTGKRDAVPFRYQGQYEDVETGLYYNRFRYYSPEEGAYISQDPIRLKGGTRPYSYVSDPNYWIDVFGLDANFDDELAEKARSVHDLNKYDERRFNNQTVTIAQGEVPNPDGTTSTQLFAAGNGATLSAPQQKKLAELGVPEDNIFSGKAYKAFDEDHTTERLLNHAERVIIRNAPEGTKFTKWGISWAGSQSNCSCKHCKPHVECASK